MIDKYIILRDSNNSNTSFLALQLLLFPPAGWYLICAPFSGLLHHKRRRLSTAASLKETRGTRHVFILNTCIPLGQVLYEALTHCIIMRLTLATYSRLRCLAFSCVCCIFHSVGGRVKRMFYVK